FSRDWSSDVCSSDLASLFRGLSRRGDEPADSAVPDDLWRHFLRIVRAALSRADAWFRGLGLYLVGDARCCFDTGDVAECPGCSESVSPNGHYWRNWLVLFRAIRLSGVDGPEYGGGHRVCRDAL